MNEIDSSIKNDNISFNYVTDTINANVFVMSGTIDQFNSYWGYNTNNNFVGAAIKFGDPNDCSGLHESKMWYTQGQRTLVHEFLHAIGFYHSSDINNIMYPSYSLGSDELSEMDKDVIFLLYHPDIINEYYDCSDVDNTLTEEEVTDLKNKLHTILETR